MGSLVNQGCNVSNVDLFEICGYSLYEAVSVISSVLSDDNLQITMEP